MAQDPAPQSAKAGQGLEKLIFSHYARSALLPILSIELSLLILYFSVNEYNNFQTEQTLKKEVREVIPHLVSQQANSINNIFSQISKQTGYFAKLHEDLYDHPEAFVVAGEQPILSKAPNGTTYQSNLIDGSSLFIPLNSVETARTRSFGIKTAALNTSYRHMVLDVPNVVAAYLNTSDNMNRLYPFIPDVYKQYPDSLKMAEFNFYYLADSLHDPKRLPVWTGVYLDPAGNGWMLSCVAPVWSNNRLEGVVGLDVTIQAIVDKILKTELPWGASAFLASDSGMILAMPQTVEALLNLQELKSHVYNGAVAKEQLKPQDYNLFANHNTEIARSFRNLYASKTALHELSLGGQNVFLSQEVIAETGWRIMVIVRREQVFQSVNEQATFSRQIGLGIIVVMLLFYGGFFVFLRRKARRMAGFLVSPMNRLIEATHKVGAGEVAQFERSGILEIDELTERFSLMSVELERRSHELVEVQVQNKLAEKDAELAYAKGLFESASGYLHNVGNAITRLGSNLMDLDSVLQSTEQYPQVFEKIRAGNSPEVLNRFEEVLVNRTVPRIRSCFLSITKIKESIQQTIAYQQAAFLKKQSIPDAEEFILSDALQQLCVSYADFSHGLDVSIRAEIPSGIALRHHRLPLMQGFENILKNAIEACERGGRVDISCTMEGEKRIIHIKDDGCGVAPEDLAKILQGGFTTKTAGHGLGLHTFAVFLSAQNGLLNVYSEGKGKGTIMTIEVGNVK